ncbi:hypothetical protein PV11_06260 [Exophiala sideris]|uniref:Uncharacterized protein n=1 Tax=Exophiala sideris TaxID=1016849 RepID=A0A0D1Y6Y2_9EURO|nr:hypothetical protein PV11_06260 [Exophiala sideris]
MSPPAKTETGTKGGGKDRKTAPGSPGSTVTIPVVKSNKPKASTPNMLQLGDVQYVGHSSKFQAPMAYPQQMQPHSSLSHGQWSYNMPPDLSMPGGVMRILGGQTVTSVRGVETIIRPEDFLKLSDQDRRALVTAGYARYNDSNIPPPPPPMQIPSPPAPPKSAVAKSKAPTKAPSITPSESISSAPDRKSKKKCVLCRQAEQMPDIEEAKLCLGCYHYHGYLMSEIREKHKRTK